jgi:hypothetical protein
MPIQGIAGIAVSQRRGNILAYKECFATLVSDGSDFSEYFICKNLNIWYCKDVQWYDIGFCRDRM